MKNINKKISFRVDASNQIGTGHFMRCLTLADSLKQYGTQIRFVCRHIPEHFLNTLTARGYEFSLLNINPSDSISDDLFHSYWLGTNQHIDSEETIQILSDRIWDWLIIDHYALDFRWESTLRKITKNILVIDDIADRKHDCDILLDQNFYIGMSNRYNGKVPTNCQLLLGPRYALIREEFRQLHKRTKPRIGPVKRVLIYFGGVDAENYTELAMEVIADIKIPYLHVDVVIGLKHPYCKQIKSKCLEYGFTCYVQTNRMSELMTAADISIGGCGSAKWERCSVGLPTIVIVQADNQRESAEALDETGIIVNLGNADQVTREKLTSAFISLIADEKKLIEMSKISLNLLTSSKYNDVVQKLIN